MTPSPSASVSPKGPCRRGGGPESVRSYDAAKASSDEVLDFEDAVADGQEEGSKY